MTRTDFARGYDEGLSIVARSRWTGVPVALLATMVTTAAQAETGTGVQATTMLTNIASFILGPFGQSLAVLAIIGIGLAWMFGRVSLGLIAGVIGGIIIMFGASYLATTLTGNGGGTTG